MKLEMMLFTTVIISLVLVPGAHGIEMGGGSSANIYSDSSLQGDFAADNTGAVSVVSALGSVPHVGELRYVQDNTGKRAEMSFDVINAVGSVGYSASFAPREGELDTAETQVLAKQTLNVPKADSIALHAAAQSAPGSNVVDVDLIINKIDSPASQARFMGSTLSQASDSNTLANVQGRVVGSILGTASYGGSAVGGPYIATKTRDSNDQKIDCSLLLQATSNEGIGAINGASIFSVDIAKNEKIQSAVDAAWDGDAINVAKGIYKENIGISKSLTMTGAGAGQTIVDGQNVGTVFNVGIMNPEVKVALLDMSIQNGYGVYNGGGGIMNRGTLALKNCRIAGNTASSGGGIRNEGTAIVSDCIITGNTGSASGGAGIHNDGGTITVISSTISDNTANSDGGGIRNDGTATLTNCLITGNTASFYGGGIFNGASREATVAGCTISGNAAIYGGGGISTQGTAAIRRCIITDNTAESGGGIINWDHGEATVTDCTIYGNEAKSNGGGISIGAGRTAVTGCTISGNKAMIYGGGIYNYDLLTLLKSNIVRNTASQTGGGIYSIGTKTLNECTVSMNSPNNIVG